MWIVGAECFDCAVGVEHGCVIASAEVSADLFEAVAGESARQVHAYLAWKGDGPGAFFALKIREAHAVSLCDCRQYVFDSHFALLALRRSPECVLGQLQVYGAAGDLCDHRNFCDGSFQFAGIGVDGSGDEARDVFGQADISESGFLVDNCQPRFVTGAVDSRDQAPLEAGDQAFFQAAHFVGAAIARDDYLLVVLVERVECVEELFLRLFVIGEELNVVDRQHVEVAVEVAELLELTFFDRFDEVVDESFARQDSDLGHRFGFDNFLADCVEQVSFAQAGTTVQEQRIVHRSRQIADRQRRRMRQAVARAGDKRLKNITVLEARGDLAKPANPIAPPGGVICVISFVGV